MNTIQVKPWGEGQGDFVLINEGDFVEGFHELFGSKKLTAKEKKAADEAAAAIEAAEAAQLLADTKAALTAKGIIFEEAATQAELQTLLDATV